MALRISDKHFLSKNLYQVMVRANQYEAFDAKKAGVKSLMTKRLNNLTKEPSFGEVFHPQNSVTSL
jgi:hypothetical protein